MKVDIVIVNFNTARVLKECLVSVEKFISRKEVGVIVVDNGSTDKSVEMIKKDFEWVTLIENKQNLGFAKGCNIGIKAVRASKYVFLLNSDTVLQDNAIEKIINFMEEGDFGIGGGVLLNSDLSLQPNAGDLPNFFPVFNWLSGLDDILRSLGFYVSSFHRRDAKYYKREGEVGWVGGTAMMIRRDVIEKIGFLEESIFMYAEDVEYCIRANLSGITVGITDKAKIIHLGGASSKEPKLNQWLGELKGLIFIYNKYKGVVQTQLLKMQVVLFIFLRMIAFGIFANPEVSKTYAKILRSI